MHPNPSFRQDSTDRHLDFAAYVGFGMVSATVDETQPPMLAHVPFLLSENRSFAELHLARGNAIVKARKDRLPAAIAIQGPHAYISPDWYAVEDQVPTWNYIAVHLTGTLVRLAQDEIRRLVEELSDHFEGRIEGKTPWRTDKMTAGTMEKMLIQIVPFRFEIEDVQGTWKLNQNKPDTARLPAAAQVENSPLGLGTGALAGLMRSVPTD